MSDDQFKQALEALNEQLLTDLAKLGDAVQAVIDSQEAVSTYIEKRVKELTQ